MLTAAKRSEHRPAWDLVDEGVHHRADADIGDHLDGQGAAQHRARIGAGQIVRQEPQRHGRQPRAQQGDHLGGEEMAVGAVGQNSQYSQPP